MYTFRIGVVGSPDGHSEAAIDRMLDEAFEQLSRGVNTGFIVTCPPGELVNGVKACASRRGWPVTSTTTLPSAKYIEVHYDAMVRIGGGEAERKQIVRFRERFRELRPAQPRPIVEYNRS